jgi:hypothetical protein
MQDQRGGNMKHRKLFFFAGFVLLVSLMVWAREDRLINTGLNPAAEGKVSTSTDRNGNTGVDVQVKHMATPQSLTPAQQTYVVWVQPRGKQPEVLGTLRVNEDLEGSLKATTPYKDFDVFVTAEDTMKPETPSSMIVLKGTVDRK